MRQKLASLQDGEQAPRSHCRTLRQLRAPAAGADHARLGPLALSALQDRLALSALSAGSGGLLPRLRSQDRSALTSAQLLMYVAVNGVRTMSNLFVLEQRRVGCSLFNTWSWIEISPLSGVCADNKGPLPVPLRPRAVNKQS